MQLAFALLAACGLSFFGAAAFIVFVRPLWLISFYRAQGLQGTSFTPLLGDLYALSKRRAMSFFDWFTPWDAAFGHVYWFFLGASFRLRVNCPVIANEVLVTHAASFRVSSSCRSASLAAVQSSGRPSAVHSWSSHLDVSFPVVSLGSLHTYACL